MSLMCGVITVIFLLFYIAMLTTVIENCIDGRESFFIHKWPAELKTNFRSCLITKLPALNNVTSNVDLNNISAIDNMLTEFTSIIHNVTDPLFRKDVTINTNV